MTTKDEVREILELHKSGFGCKEIHTTGLFPVTVNHIDAILKGKKWAYITNPSLIKE